MLDAQQVGDEAVTTGLGLHAVARVDQDDRQTRGRGASGHVAGVLLVPRRVGDDELALVGREEAIGDIDGDALLTLGLQAIDQQRQIDLAGGTALLGIAGDGGQLIFIDHLGVVKQATDQGRLAVIHAAAGDETQQVFLLVFPEIGFDVFRDHRRLV